MYGDCSKGNRPSFISAAKPEYANEIYEYIIEKCKSIVKEVKTGVFGANMQVNIVNSGPVTIILEK
ncbi:D-tyrosyl-tRNA(Tyr) deacylase [compost metagenome]